MKQSDDTRITRQAVFVAITLMVLVLLLDIVQFSLDETPPPDVVEAEPPTPWLQCQVWNKWAEWPIKGQCSGDLQGRWWR